MIKKLPILRQFYSNQILWTGKTMVTLFFIYRLRQFYSNWSWILLHTSDNMDGKTMVALVTSLPTTVCVIYHHLFPRHPFCLWFCFHDIYSEGVRWMNCGVGHARHCMLRREGTWEKKIIIAGSVGSREREEFNLLN